MNVFMFPGQGAQFKGMGKEYFERFRSYIDVASDVLGYSVRDLCLEDPDSILDQTEYTQPALYTVNALHYIGALEDGAPTPDYLVGHSLGEYNALFAAGVFDFETGLRLTKLRGELMSQATRGGMAAVLGLEEQQVRDALVKQGLDQVFVANFNAPTQIVVSGAKEQVKQASDLFEAMSEANCVPLSVSGAFHSPLMQPAREQFDRFLGDVEFHELSIPVVANATARPYPKSGIKDVLSEQMTNPVRWTDSVRFLMGVGETEFREVGPGEVLTRLVQRIRSEATPLPDGGSQEAVVVNAARSSGSPARREGTEEQSRTEAGRLLGSHSFKRDYGVDYAYYAGAMFKGIASKELVARMGKAGLMGFVGTGGMSIKQIEDSICYLQHELGVDGAYGMNLLSSPAHPEEEDEVVDLYLKYGVRVVEASAYIQVSPALVRFRLAGLARGADGSIRRGNRVIAKISRPEVAAAFLDPPPERIVRDLLERGAITREQAELAAHVPVADDICAEADSGGHTDGAVAYALLPTIIRQRDKTVARHGYSQEVRVGAAGGIGTPQAALAAFMLGADFIATGSINQCSVEAGNSDAVKDLLQSINVQDTDYAPAGDMFELGAKVQVLKKGVFFPARANKLYELYRRYDALEEIDERTRNQIQDKYFKRSFDEVWDETRNYYLERHPEELDKADRNPKHKMALIFKWYFVHTSRLARQGDTENKVDFQVHCGPALGAFNQWAKGTDLESWSHRHVDVIAKRMMAETAQLLDNIVERYAPEPQRVAS